MFTGLRRRQAFATGNKWVYAARMDKFIPTIAGLALLCAGPAAAQSVLDRLTVSTEASFPRVPVVRIMDDVSDVCGGGVTANAVYCTSDNTIYLAPEGKDGRDVYALAHLYGHGLQVRYGIADLALNAILANREREAELRGMVTRQVECLAGFLVARAGIEPPRIADLFEAEPMTGAHWGRRPVRAGPEVSIGLAARATWFAHGAAATTALDCTVEEVPADLIAAADRG